MGWEVQWTVYEKTQFRNDTHTHTQRHAADTPSSSSSLPSPCAVFPPLHPDCSQAQTQWRWCWRRLVDCSASPLVQQSDIQETRSPPQSNGPEGHRHRFNKDKVRTDTYVCVNIDSLLHLPRTKAWHSRGKIKCWCVIGSSNNVCPHQFNKPDQAVIKGSDDGAVLDKLVQTLLVERLGSYKV